MPIIPVFESKRHDEQKVKVILSYKFSSICKKKKKKLIHPPTTQTPSSLTVHMLHPWTPSSPLSMCSIHGPRPPLCPCTPSMDPVLPHCPRAPTHPPSLLTHLLPSIGAVSSSELISMGNMSSSSDELTLSSLLRLSNWAFLLLFLLFFPREPVDGVSLGGRPWAAVVGSRHLILSTEFLFSWLSILAAPSDRMGDVARYMGMIS